MVRADSTFLLGSEDVRSRHVEDFITAPVEDRFDHLQCEADHLVFFEGPRACLNRNGRKSCVNSEIGHSDDSFHFVLLTGREVHDKIRDVAGFDTDHLYPFVIRKI